MSGDFLNGNSNPDIPDIEYRCPHCDEPLGEDKTFCHKCGKYLGQTNGGYKPITNEQASKIRLIVGVVAVVVFLILFFVLK